MPAEKRDPLTWRQSWELLDHAERLSRTFFLRRASAARPVWEPPVDVFESESAVWIVVALPGVDPTRVELSIDGKSLVVAGEGTRPRACAHLEVKRLEIPHGRFERRVELSEGRYRMDSSEVVDGCLVVQLSRL